MQFTRPFNKRFKVLGMLMMSGSLMLGGINAKALSLPSIPLPDNTHLIDQDTTTGFAIYRSSKPNKAADFKKLCAAGVTEMMVLDGTGSVDEKMAAKYCPDFRVVYNISQDAKTPL